MESFQKYRYKFLVNDHVPHGHTDGAAACLHTWKASLLITIFLLAKVL